MRRRSKLAPMERTCNRIDPNLDKLRGILDHIEHYEDEFKYYSFVKNEEKRLYRVAEILGSYYRALARLAKNYGLTKIYYEEDEIVIRFKR